MTRLYSNDELEALLKANPDLAIDSLYGLNKTGRETALDDMPDRVTVKKVSKYHKEGQSIPHELEEDFQAKVVQLFQLHGWLVHGERASINRRGQWSTPIVGNKGFPDLVLCHLAWHTLILVELKSDR